MGAATGSVAGPLDLDAVSLVILNPLSAPIYVALVGSRPATATDYDVACPGQAMMTYPLPAAATGNVRATVVYSGAVPAADVGQTAIISSVPELVPPVVGRLA